MIPPFANNGLLPPGIHSETWQIFVQRFGGTVHRENLIRLMKLALINLRNAGCIAAYIDGSFVTDKKVPSDYDMCWSSVGNNGQYVDATLLDPVLLDFSNGRAAMKAKYGGDIFIAEYLEGKSNKLFLDFFQVDKQTGDPKGIVLIDPRNVK